MAQKRFVSIATSEKSEILYEQIKAKSRIKKVNAMLRSLKESDYYDESIAVENLFNYLGTEKVDIKKTKKGYVSIRGLSSKSVTQITAINKEISEFIKNKTSTVSGMEELYEERRNELYRFIDDKDFVNSLSYHDIRTIYSVFQSNEYKRLQSRMGSQEFFTLLTQSIDEQWNKQKFIKEMKNYLPEGNDEDLKKNVKDIIKIYNSRIKSYTNR